MRLSQRAIGIAVTTAVVSTAGFFTLQELGGAAPAVPAAPAGGAAVAGGQLQYNTEGPVRIYDSRTTGVALTSDVFGTHVVSTLGFVPDNATAVLVNLTVVAGGEGTTGFVGLGGETYQGTSTVNWTEPGVYSNFAFVPISTLGVATEGKLFRMRFEGNRPIHVVIDLQGWVVT
jgi:hypothetical protein